MKTRIEQNEPNDPAYGEASGTPTSQTVEVDGNSATAPTSGFRAFVRRRELVIFFVLSYLIAWSTLPFGSFLAFSPLFSAIIVVTIAEGWRGLAQLGRRVIRWRVNWIWYAAAIGLPLLVHAVAIALNMAAGATAPSLTQFQPWYAVLLLFGLRMVNFTDGPLGEEPAWRGFAQPRLQSKWSPLASTALLGVLITGWHLHAPVRPRPARHCVDCRSHLLVCLVVQPDGRQRAAPAHCPRDRGLHQHSGPLAGWSRCRPAGLDLVAGLDPARRRSVDFRSQILAHGTGVGNRSSAWPDQLITGRAVPSLFALCMACMPCTARTSHAAWDADSCK